MIPPRVRLVSAAAVLALTSGAPAHAQRTDAARVFTPAASAAVPTRGSSAPRDSAFTLVMAARWTESDVAVALAATERKRPWWLLPAVGAGVAAVAYASWFLPRCSVGDDGCWGIIIGAPYAAAGALLGGLAELAVRGIEDIRRE